MSEQEIQTLIDRRIRAADALYYEGRFQDSLKAYDELCEIVRKKLGEDHPLYAHCLNDNAVVFYWLGRFFEAESRFLKVKKIYSKTVGESHPAYGNVLHNLGDVYSALDDDKRAEDVLRQAIDLKRKTLGRNHPNLALSLNNLALLYCRLGDYATAEALARDAVTIWRRTRDPASIATGLNSLALALDGKGETREAESLWREAVSIAEDMAARSNLGVLCDNTGRYKEAEKHLRAVMENDRKTLGEDHPNLALSLGALGEHLRRVGHYAESEALLRQAIEIERVALGDDHNRLVSSLFRLATLCAETSREAEALALMKRAQSIVDRVIGHLFSCSSARVRLDNVARFWEMTGAYLSLLHQCFADSSEEVRGALDLVLRRKGLVAEVTAVEQEVVLRGRYPHLQDQLKQLASLRMQVAHKAMAAPGPEGLSAHRTVLAEWLAEIERLEVELARGIPEIEHSQRLRRADIAAVAGALPEGSTLIEYVRYHHYDFLTGAKRPQARYLAFLLPAHCPDAVRMKDLGLAEPIDRQITEFHAMIAEKAPKHDGAEVAIGDRIRVAILDPLLEDQATPTILFLAPDGDLSVLPFQVLPAADGGYLLDRYVISYLGVGRELLRFGADPASPLSSPIVVADPAFDLAASDAKIRPLADVPATEVGHNSELRGCRFSRLPGTRAEGIAIAQLLGVQAWLGEDALEGRLKTVRSPRVLHIATHGFFLKSLSEEITRLDNALRPLGPGCKANPLLRSGLVLAGANTWLSQGSLPPEAEDGVLTAMDVSGLDLLDTELVVLSACDTGLGEVHVGEGVLGLRRAFVLAGARALVISLWKVSDEATQKLMTTFYENLLAGQARAEALRAAQQAVRSEHPHPCDWGAFICQGETGVTLADPLNNLQGDV